MGLLWGLVLQRTAVLLGWIQAKGGGLGCLLMCGYEKRLVLQGLALQQLQQLAVLLWWTRARGGDLSCLLMFGHYMGVL